jgi:hypothetical protein
MFDNIVSNKYFIIALIIALIVVLYLYSQKKSCDIEGMKNVDLISLSQDIRESPGANNNFDKSVDNYHNKKKIGKNNFLKRKDEIFQNYSDHDDSDFNPENTKKKIKKISTNIPKPYDNRPDLSQCQPCICPEKTTDDYEHNIKKKNKKKYSNNQK